MSATTAKLAVLAVTCAGLAACAAQPPSTFVSAVGESQSVATVPSVGAASSPTADANARAGDGSTPIQWAVYNGDVAEVARLIKAGADVKMANSYGATPMSLAATTGNAAVIKLLLNAGADVESANAEGQTALMAVARTGNVEAAKLLLQHGANVNARETWGQQSALMWAASQKHPEMIRLLVSKGADVNAHGVVRDWDRKVTAEGRPKDMNRGGFTPMLYAAREGCVECVRELLKGKADIDLADPHGTSPLVLALMNMKFDTAKFLIENGANISLWDYYGQTPLYVAVDMHTVPTGFRADVPSTDAATSMDIIQLLLDRGTNVNAQLKLRPPVRSLLPGDRGADVRVLTTGATPLMRASVAADLPVIEVLLKHGALVDLPLADGTTPFFATVLTAGTRARAKTEASALEAMRVLKKAGADPNARTAGSTPLLTATSRGWTDVMKELVSYGVDINAKDSDGLTALDYALARIRIGFLQQKPPVRNDLAKLLRDMGANVENPNLPPWPSVPTPTITAQVPD
ncbi:MAG: ankyrin repeat domain-containing protein [Gammaproteobacteria bacterium]